MTMLDELAEKHKAECVEYGDFRLDASYKSGYTQALKDFEPVVSSLRSIISATHSWVITEESGRYVKPHMDAIRQMAQSALESWRKIAGEK